MKSFMKKLLSTALAGAMTVGMMTGCGSSYTNGDYKSMSYDDAVTELKTLSDSINETVAYESIDKVPVDMNYVGSDIASSLADIDTFKMVVEGEGDINIEIAAPSEFTSLTSNTDNWLVEQAKAFNRSGYTIDGSSVSVSIRAISSGETVTYMVNGGYTPDAYVPSNNAFGKMLKASGIGVVKVTDRLAGNTAGILMKKDTYDKVTEKYGEVTISNVLDAAIAGDIMFGYTNPYTSATGLNMLTAMLYAFDSSNPLSDTASSKLIEYQKNAPTAAYTTSVLRNSAAKGIIDAMVMEEQSYINTAELKNYVYTPAGLRHDHPVYTFDYVSEERQDAVKAFVDYCLSDSAQKSATEKGFNRTESYTSQDTGLDGAGYIAAQQIWKQNKNGGNPVVAVFIADNSGSMNGVPIASLKKSLSNTIQYIGEDNYIGLITYDGDVTVQMPIAQFNAVNQSRFSYIVNNKMEPGSTTATYDAVVVGLQMLIDYKEQVPDATPMLFVLTDGNAKGGKYSLDRIIPVVNGLDIPVYTIGYGRINDLTGEIEGMSTEEITKLAEVNEASCIKSDTDGIVNELRNLFNVNM